MKYLQTQELADREYEHMNLQSLLKWSSKRKRNLHET